LEIVKSVYMLMYLYVCIYIYMCGEIYLYVGLVLCMYQLCLVCMLV
jgi:hypothetical protein